MLVGLYERWLEKGFTVQSFYDSSLQEVVDCLDAYERNKKKELQMKAIQDQTLAIQIHERIAYIFNSDNVQLTPIYQLWPDLFEKPVTDDMEMDMAMELHKAKMEEYAHYHNLTRKRQVSDRWKE